MSGYSVLISTSPSSSAGWSATKSSGSPSSAAAGTRVVRRPSRMWRAKVWPSASSRRPSSRSRSRWSPRRGRRPRAGSRAGASSSTRRAGASRRSTSRAESRAKTLGVEVEVGAERPGLALEGLGGLDTAGSGWTSDEQSGGRGDAVQRHGGVVPEVEHDGVAGGRLLEGGDPGGRRGEAGARVRPPASRASRPRRTGRDRGGAEIGSMPTRLVGGLPRLLGSWS